MEKSDELEILKNKVLKLEKTKKALMERVKNSVASQGSAFSLFEGNIILQREVLEKTNELEKAKKEVLKQQKALDAVALITEYNLEGKIIYANERSAQVSGYSMDQLLGMTSLEHVAEDETSFDLREINSVIKTGETYRKEFKYKRADQSSYWLDSFIYPTLAKDGQLSGVMVVSIDITEKKEKEAQLLHQAKLASIGEMAAGIGHEINNPLAIMVGNVNFIEKLLTDQKIYDPKLLEHLKKITAAAERIKKIVDGMRIYSRTEKEGDEVFCVCKVIDETLDLISEIYAKDGVTISKTYCQSNLHIKGSVGKVQQILMNLIGNAKDAIEANKGAKKIDISVENAGEGELLISVKDNGHGIEPKNLVNILEPFFTTKEVGRGTGLGLGIVNEIVKSMQGRLEVESEVGKGANFKIYLPSSQEVLDKSKAENIKSANDFKGRALVIDDEPDIRELVCFYLEELGLDVDEADDGDTGLEKVKINQYEFIFTDMKMKRVQGEDFIRQARQLENGKKAKIFVVTGGVKCDWEELSKFSDGLINKPFTSEDLSKALKKNS